MSEPQLSAGIRTDGKCSFKNCEENWEIERSDKHNNLWRVCKAHALVMWPSLRVRDTDQPLPYASDHPGVQDMVIFDLKELQSDAGGVLGLSPIILDLLQEDVEKRKQIGLDRYGQLLKPFDGRNALRDLYEECIDAIIYSRKVSYERSYDHVSVLIYRELLLLTHRLKELMISEQSM